MEDIYEIAFWNPSDGSSMIYQGYINNIDYPVELYRSNNMIYIMFL